MRSLNALSFAVLATGVLASGCTQDAGSASTGTPGVNVSASARAKAQFGVDRYVITRDGAADDRLAIELRAADGTHLGDATMYQLPYGRGVVRVSIDGSVTDIVTDAEAMTVARDGVVRYTLDRAQANASTGSAELSATMRPIPEDLTRAVGLAAVVVNDQAVIDYAAATQPAGTAYLITDCPWWVTALACMTFETGVGAIMCAACGLSYLL